jgi:hypothetical protein
MQGQGNPELAAEQCTTNEAWEGRRLEVFAPYKRVVAWFPGPSEYVVHLFHCLFWLKEGLSTG